MKGLDLRRVLPGTGMGGVVGLSSRMQGPLDDVAAKVAFSKGSAITVFDQNYLLPAQARFALQRGEQLVVPTLTLAAPGGGSLSVAGRLIADRNVDLSVIADQHRLDRVPFVSRTLPSLGGTLGGRLHLSGHPQNPSLDGDVRLAQVTLAGVALGAGAMKLQALGPGRSTLKGLMFERLTVAGNLNVGAGGPAFDATVDANNLTLDPFLSELPLVRGGRLRVGGRLSLAAQAGRPLELVAALDSVLLAYGCRAASGDPRGPGCMVLESKGPLRARTRGRSLIELDRAQFVAPDSDFSLVGKMSDGLVDAQLKGRFGLGVLDPLLQVGGRRLFEASGVLDATVRARGNPAALALSGAVAVVKPVRLASAAARLEVRVPRGQLTFEPGRISSAGLQLEAPGLKLELAGEGPTGDLLGPEPRPGAPARPLAVDLSGTFDAGLLPRFLPGWITEARGSASIKGHLAGSLARPSIDGEAQLGAISFTTRANPSQPQRFRVDVQGGRIEARKNVVTVDHLAGHDRTGGTRGGGAQRPRRPGRGSGPGAAGARADARCR